MNTIAIFGKELKENHICDLQKIISRIEKEKYDIVVYIDFYHKISNLISFSKQPSFFADHNDLVNNTECLFSVGGDGTLLDSLHFIRNSGIPVLGFNFGRMGFLSIVKRDNIDNILDEYFGRKFELDERCLIKIDCETEKIDGLNFGLNEICFSRNDPYSMIVTEVWINDLYLNKYWADGLIIATPTGSTAYSLACGGPILYPKTQSFVISPIASHNLTVGSIVIPDDSVIRVKVECREKLFCMNVDSMPRYFKTGSIFTVKKNDFSFNLIHPESENFFKTIREKLNWGLDVRN